MRNQDLRLNQIKAGDTFGHGVFDLNAGINLDKIEFGCINIHQEFDRAGIHIAGCLAQPDGGIADFLALRVIKIGGGCAFDDFLIAALNRTITFIQMNKCAVVIAQKLYLNMAGAADQFFKIHLPIAKGSLGFAACTEHLIGQVLAIFNDAHTASTAAPACLEHQRIAELLGNFGDFGHVFGQGRGCRHDRHIGGFGQITRRYLIAQKAHHIRIGADKLNACLGTGIRKLGVFR